MREFPCPLCGKDTTSRQHALACDECDLWFHKQCLRMDTTEYKELAKSSELWFCPNCANLAQTQSRSSDIHSNEQHKISSKMSVLEAETNHQPLVQTKDPQIAPFSLIPGKISMTPAPNAKRRDWDTSLYATSQLNSTSIQTPIYHVPPNC